MHTVPEHKGAGLQIRILKKKVQQIEGLEVRGVPALDPQQQAKVAAKPLLVSALALLEQGTPLPEVQALLAAAKEGEQTLGLAPPLASMQQHTLSIKGRDASQFASAGTYLDSNQDG